MDMLSSSITIFNQFSIPGSDIVLDLPNYGGIFENGVFSAIGLGMFVFISILVVVWVGFTLYGAFSIISSLGDPQKIEKGWKTIKSVWIGISYFLLFFTVVSLVAVFIGVGAPWHWVDNLQQCANGGPAAGRFYFQGKVEGDKRLSYIELMNNFNVDNPAALNAYVLCCENNDRQYIDIVRFPSAPPAGCSVNSSRHIQGPPSNPCKGTGVSCGSESECCSNKCELSGGGMRCAP